MNIYVKDDNYFEVINTEAKAYFLGLLFADGTVASDRIDKDGRTIKRSQVVIELGIQDKHILEDFSEELNSNYKLYFRKSSLVNDKWSDKIMLSICSPKMKSDLINLGCMPNKTKKLVFPDSTKVPDDLLRHFIRGYFDGDGCVWIGKRKPFTFNDNVIGKRRTRIIHNMKFTFVGLDTFIESVKEVLVNKVGFNDVKINHHKRNPRCASLEYSGRNNILKLYDYMYKDAAVFFKRKELVFKSLL